MWGLPVARDTLPRAASEGTASADSREVRLPWAPGGGEEVMGQRGPGRRQEMSGSVAATTLPPTPAPRGLSESQCGCVLGTGPFS